MQRSDTAAGSLRERVEVLALTETEDGFAWQPERRVWANVMPLEKNTIFSKVGITAPGVQLVLRRQALTLMQALSWRGQHIFLTDVQPQGHGHLRLTGALVKLTDCVADDNLPVGGKTFPAVVTEKYVQHEQLDPYAVNVMTYVLVTPKAVELTRGALVKAGEKRYAVQLAHVLEDTRNEYEIVRTEDL